MHRWRESASDDRREIVESVDLQPPEAIICWDGFEASEVRPRPRKWIGAAAVSFALVAACVALCATVAR
jgi:elongation factor P hydroxylase